MRLLHHALLTAALAGAACAGSPPADPPLPAAIVAPTDSSNDSAAPEEQGRVLMEIERLPRDAAAYLVVHPARIDELTAMLPREADVLLRETLGLPSRTRASGRALAERFGLAPNRPLLLAWMGPSAAETRPILDAFVGGASAEETAAAISAASHAPVTAMRLIVLLAPGADAAPLVAWLKKLGVRHRMAIAVRQRDDVAEIDVVLPLFQASREPSVAAALEQLGEVPTGGPEAPRCRALEPLAAASLCLDADRAAEQAAGWGYAQIIEAVGSSNIDPKVAREIAAAGRDEAEKALVLARPSRLLLNDATVSLSAPEGVARLVASWQVEDARDVLSEFARAACASGGEAFLATVVPRLRDAFGDPGPEFRDARARIEDVALAGGVGTLLVGARTWPHFLGYLASQPPTKELRALDALRICARAAEGRFELELTGAIRL